MAKKRSPTAHETEMWSKRQVKPKKKPLKAGYRSKVEERTRALRTHLMVQARVQGGIGVKKETEKRGEVLEPLKTN